MVMKWNSQLLQIHLELRYILISEGKKIHQNFKAIIKKILLRL